MNVYSYLKSYTTSYNEKHCYQGKISFSILSKMKIANQKEKKTSRITEK